jgi:hypothetical protein
MHARAHACPRPRSTSWLLIHAALIAALALVASVSRAEEPRQQADVTLHENPVFRLYRGEGDRPVKERAQRASRVLGEIAETATADQVATERRGDRVIVTVGAVPIIELKDQDAALAGDPTVDAHAARIAASLKTALTRERRRSNIANTVFSASLVVFFGLVTLYLMRKLHEFSGRSRRFLVNFPQRVPALRLQRLEVLGPAALRSVLLLLISVAHGLGLFGLAYAWLMISLSLFGATRPFVERLTGFVLSPISSLVGRTASALPLLVVVLIAGALIAVIVRIAELFFASVARGETHLPWLEPELAQATSTLVRAGLVLFAMVFAAPVITGDADGPISRTGFLLLLALGLASTPLLASLLAGVVLAFSRVLRVGDRVEYGGHTGRVREVGVFSLILEDGDGGTLRVPHARSLWHPTRVFARGAP